MSPISTRNRNSWLLAIFALGAGAFMYLLYDFDSSMKARSLARAQAGTGMEFSGADAAAGALSRDPLHGTSPVRLIIPRIRVDAPVEKVGITATGAMGAPKEPDRAGWLRSNPAPGEKGSAVIDGHRGWIGHIDAVFDRLHELKPGDLVYVKDNTGTTTTFTVRRVKTYDPKDDTSEVFDSREGRRLNLITCDGDWDKFQQDYAQRLVVFTERE